MEWIGLLIILGALFGFYMLDRDGWHATAKRVGRIVRANVEAKKPIKQLEASKDLTKDAWEAAFEGKQLEELEESKLKHVIVKTGYTRGLRGEDWPCWTCKCGANGSTSIVNGWDWAFKYARQEANGHVKHMNESEARREASKNKQFAWEV